MNLAELRKKLRESLVWLSEYRNLKAEDRTEEKRTEKDAKMQEVEQIEADIRDLEKIEQLEQRNKQVINDPQGGEERGGRIEVVDQPIYRGNFALGLQARDMIDVFRGKDGALDARERLGQAEKREREVRAAGTGMVEAIGQDGGWLMQGESTVKLMADGWNNNAILPRTDNISLSGAWLEELNIDDSNSRATGSRSGGIRWYSDAELDSITSSKTSLKKKRYETERLTGLFYMSNEIAADVPALQGQMEKLFRDELSFVKQDLVINGSGVGEALGFMTSAAVIQVTKETGQTAATIVNNNCIKMLARVKLTNMSNLVWLVNQDTLPQLMTMTIDVGTGGTISKAFVPNISGAPGILGTLHGFPVIPVEQCQTLGTAGDIILCDLKGYRTLNKGGVESAVSAHIKFEYNQLAVRFVTRFGGQPKQDGPLTPYKGTATVSHYIKLQSRA